MGTFSQHLRPTAHKTYDIGVSPSPMWRNGYFDGTVHARYVKSNAEQNLDLSVQTVDGRFGIGLANEVPSWVEVRPRGLPQSSGQKFDSNPFTIVSAYWDSASNRKEQLELFTQVKQTGIPDGYVVFNFRRTYPEGDVIEWESDFLKVNHGEGFPRIPAGKLYLEGAYGELQFYESTSSKWLILKRESGHATQRNRLILSFFDGTNWKEMLHLDPPNNRLIPGVNNVYSLGSSSFKWAHGYFTKLHGEVGDPQPLAEPLSGLPNLKQVQFRPDGLPLGKTLPTRHIPPREEVLRELREKKIMELIEKGRSPEDIKPEEIEPTQEDVEDAYKQLEDTVNLCHTIGWLTRCCSQLMEKVESLEAEVAKLKETAD